MSLLSRISNIYRNRSLQLVISISFTIVTLMGMVFMGMSLFLRFTMSTEAMVSEESRRVIDQVNLNMDAYLRNMMRVSDSMYYRVIKNTDLATETLDDEMNLLYETNRDVVVSIAVFSRQGALVTATPLNNSKVGVTPETTDWFQNAMGKIENFHFSTPHVQNLFEDPDYRYRWVISLSRAVELTTDGNTQNGVLLVDMNFSGIEQICKDVSIGTGGYLYLIDSEGEIIYHPRQQLLFSNLIKENNKAAAKYEDGAHDEVFEGESRLVTVKTVGYTGWKIVGVIPQQNVMQNAAQIRLFVIFIAFFTMFLMTFINMFVSYIIANPIRALDESVKQLEAGAKDVNIAVGGSYEIEHLGQSIRSMVAQMRQLMDDVVKEHEAKRKSELDALQSQINPHFLYNTLDSIIWMVENGRYPDAIAMVTSLARLFRIGLSKGKNIITVEEELEHARHYMTIQQMRYKNKFEVRFHAAPETLGLATIKLTIQPILENAIYHGMEFMSGDGLIEVNTYLQDDDLYIDVIDNGLGMPADKVIQLLTSGAGSSSSGGSGIGVKNVLDRIQLYFGPEYGLDIESEPDVGTTVRIHLPQTTPDAAGEQDGVREGGSGR